MIPTLFRAVRSKGAYVNACTASLTSGKASVVAQHLNQRVDQRDSNLSGLLFEVAHCSFHPAVLRGRPPNGGDENGLCEVFVPRSYQGTVSPLQLRFCCRLSGSGRKKRRWRGIGFQRGTHVG
jgi:hypothetical protein